MKNFIPHKGDWFASLGVFIVALPLSLGIAMASGASPASGIVSALVGGILVGALSGAPLVVSGPAAGLVAMIFQYVSTYGLSSLVLITAIAGVIQVVLGILRCGRWFEAVPKPVLQGMLAAIGIMIAAGQLHVLVGAKMPGNFLENLLGFPAVLRESVIEFSPALIAGLLALGVQILFGKLPRVAVVPPALPAVLITTFLFYRFEIPRVEIAALGDTASEGIRTFLSQLNWTSIWMLFVPSMGLAVVASAETLLTARAIDTIASRYPGHKSAELNRELIAQGIGNSVSGILGGLPMTGVIVRSAANLNFGARTRWSAILHGVWIGSFVLLVPNALEAIPLSALASVLVLTGLKLANPAQVMSAFKRGFDEGFLWLVSFVAIVSTNLLTGLVIAIMTSVFLHLLKTRTSAKWGVSNRTA